MSCLLWMRDDIVQDIGKVLDGMFNIFYLLLKVVWPSVTSVDNVVMGKI